LGINIEMDSRKQTILAATIDQYIQTAEPVGSKALAHNEKINVSSATIRSELGELEEEGYLMQVHTSSGRMPTDLGYREYVNTLMNPVSSAGLESTKLRPMVKLVSDNFSGLLQEITDVMTRLVDYTTIVVTPGIFKDSLRAVHLVLVDMDKVLVVLLNSIGMNQEVLVELEDRVDQEDLNKVSKLLTHKLEGKSVFSLTEDMCSELVSQIPALTDLVKNLQGALDRLRSHHQNNTRLITGGKAKMLKLPEFSNIQLAQKVFEALEEDRVLLNLVQLYLDRDKTNVVIGKENDFRQFNECSVVLAPINLGETGEGAIGLIGPTRMAYSKILPLVQSVSEQVSRYLTQILDNKICSEGDR